MAKDEQPEPSNGEDDENGNGDSPKPGRRKKNGKVFISPERCKGCGYCVAFCPSHVLVLASSFNRKGYHPPEVVDADACSGCDLCGMYCPDFAIFGVKVKRVTTDDEAVRAA
jgi:2-oxoglutarate ferredoxin oxidoreductase subunit delta